MFFLGRNKGDMSVRFYCLRAIESGGGAGLFRDVFEKSGQNIFQIWE
jgi:hypothetical protein